MTNEVNPASAEGDQPHVLCDSDGAVATIRLNRPKALNALTGDMIGTIRARLARLAVDDGVRSLLLLGNGRAFCSGADLTDPMMGMHLPVAERPAACAATLDGLMNAMVRDLRNLPFPTVCAVNGIAAGGGMGLALTADIVLAARSARFIQTFTPKLGLTPDFGSSWHVARHLGRARALGMVLTGEPVDGPTAEAWGLVWKCVDDDALEREALDLARRLAAGPRLAQRRARELVDRALTESFDAQLDVERDMQASLVETPEVAEAIAAFGERRAPDFVGAGGKPPASRPGDEDARQD